MKTEGNFDDNYIPRLIRIDDGATICAFQFILDKIVEELLENRLVPFNQATIHKDMRDIIRKREFKIFQSCDFNLYAFTEFDYAALILSLLPSP